MKKIYQSPYTNNVYNKHKKAHKYVANKTVKMLISMRKMEERVGHKKIYKHNLSYKTNYVNIIFTVSQKHLGIFLTINIHPVKRENCIEDKLFKFFSLKKRLLMFLSRRHVCMLDSTTIEFHLIDHCFRKSDKTIGILTIKTIESLSEIEFPEFISIENNIMRPLQNRNIVYSKINILELPKKSIHDNKRKNAYIGRYSSYDIEYWAGALKSYALRRNHKSIFFHSIIYTY